jgi:hypothetical protein
MTTTNHRYNFPSYSQARLPRFNLMVNTSRQSVEMADDFMKHDKK